MIEESLGYKTGLKNLKKLKHNHEIIPRFYGIAYYDWSKGHVAVCYPLGINLIVMLWREFVSWNKNPKQGGPQECNGGKS